MAPPLSSRSTNSLNQPRHVMREDVDPKQVAIRASTSSPRVENRNRETQPQVEEEIREQLEREREREQSTEAHRQEVVIRQRQHPWPGQAGPADTSIDIANVTRKIQGFMGKLNSHFGNNPEVIRQFSAIMGSAPPIRNSMPKVVNLFRTVPDLIQSFSENAEAFDQYRYMRQSQLVSSPQSRGRPSLPTRTRPQTARHVPNDSDNDTDRDSDGDDDDDDDDSQYDGDDGAMYGAMHRANSDVPFPALKDSQHKEIQKLLSMPEIDIPKELRKNTPAAMSCELFEHQRISLTWMRQQEEDPVKKGGLLADTMGLGKTIQAVALILDRPSTDPMRKTTLIVAPLALLKQWQQEIRTKVKPRHQLKTIIYHGSTMSTSAMSKMTVTTLLTYDVVLTTYGMVRSESYRRKKNTRRILLDAVFYRVILDEAHNIKNRKAKSSIAADRIKATYRWCMTGTPFMNRIDELYSLLRFLKIKPFNEWNAFSVGIDKPIKSLNENFQGEAMRKLQAVFRSITLRRTKKSMLDGKPILRLPELIKEDAMTTFDEEQKAFYDALEKKQQLEINKFIKAGTMTRKYTYILVLLLRLRQACCHPHLIKDFGIPEGTQLGSDDMCNLAKNLKRDVVERLKGQTEFECPLCHDTTKNPLIIYPCGHPICNVCFSALMEVKVPGAERQYQCYYHDCRTEIDPEKVICHCFFVEVHMPEKRDSEASEDDSDDDSDGFQSFDEEDDVDVRGNLKDFIASDSEVEYDDDSEEEDDDEDEDKEAVQDEDNSEGSDADDSGPSIDTKPKQPSISRDEISKGVPKEEPADEKPAQEDSDNDSLASLSEVWRRAKMVHLRKEEPKQTKRDMTPNSKSNARTPVKKETSPMGKRKRSNGKEAIRSRKKSKRNDGASGKQRKGKGKKKGFVSLADLKRASTKNQAAKAKYLKRLRRDWVPSAKIEKTMELLQAIREKNPKEKTLVFSLWTSFLDLLEIPIHDEGFRYTRYDGSMHPGDRDLAVKAFMDKDVQVMLVSLTAGNTGLNLTKATQVIILEPFWNPFVEEQAIDRAHRIGQEKEVTVHHLLIENTVEDRIRSLQERKRSMVEAALSEEGAQGVGQLSFSELKGLFGLE
ncbi:hypothetical protein F4818DRAFT_441514 [Hypoxylon cercidicola]|nr:hypothetical protein F4818DRAFT_441514 [Hypoxylon cercidicola]